MDADAILTSLDYEAGYYEEHKKAGLDYLGHGYWQQSYAAMVCDATFQREYQRPFFLDAGCACGSILKGFKDTGIFHKVVGADLSNHMVQLGKKHFRFLNEEIICADMSALPLQDRTVTLLHSAQVLEHVPEANIKGILQEFRRITAPGGRIFICLDAVKHGQTPAMYMQDPTHVNIKPMIYWTRLFQEHGFLFDVEAYERFVRSPAGPTMGKKESFFEEYKNWSAYTFIKEKQ